MTIGIYSLTFGDKVYVGQSSNIEKRYEEHCYSLSRGDSSAKVQLAYKKYGMPILAILEETSIELLDSLEQDYIDKLDTINNGLNTAGGNIKVLRGDSHFNSKYSNEMVLEVFNLLCKVPFVPLAFIASSTGVSISVVENISRGISHRWLQEKYPDMYAQLLANKGNRKTSAATAHGRGKLYPPLISPTGTVFTVTNAKAFSLEHGLNHSHIVGVLNSKRKSHKGWKLFKEVVS